MHDGKPFISIPSPCSNSNRFEGKFRNTLGNIILAGIREVLKYECILPLLPHAATDTSLGAFHSQWMLVSSLELTSWKISILHQADPITTGCLRIQTHRFTWKETEIKQASGWDLWALHRYRYHHNHQSITVATRVSQIKLWYKKWQQQHNKWWILRLRE